MNDENIPQVGDRIKLEGRALNLAEAYSEEKNIHQTAFFVAAAMMNRSKSEFWEAFDEVHPELAGFNKMLDHRTHEIVLRWREPGEE